MANETVENEAYILPWYLKVFEYLKNRNKIGPVKIELPDCDFFIVGPSRTIRVLRPSLKLIGHNGVQSESVNENDISRSAKRTDSSNNCHCSFLQSLNTPFTKEESVTLTEINRNGICLFEAEKTINNIEKMDEKISAKINTFSAPITDQSKLANFGSSFNNRNSHDLINKNKIIRDLEQCIDVLLEEVLYNTVKFMSDADNTLKKSRVLLKSSNSKDTDSSNNSLEINFAFLANNSQVNVDDKKLTEIGYINQGFEGNTADPDCLDFDLGKPVNSYEEKIECVDSGINSVETVELQLESGQSLEKSLMQIIDATFENWEDLVVKDTLYNQESTFEDHDSQYSIKEGRNIFSSKNNDKGIDHKINEINELLNSKTNNLSLDLILDDPIDEHWKHNHNPTTIKDREKNSIDYSDKNHESVQMQDYRAAWKGFKTHSRISDARIVYCKNCKPVIVFIHGFGSSADVFKPQMEYFTKLGYSCIAPDLLGHGMSSSPKRSREYHFNKLLNDLELVLQHYAFRPGQECILVAHNYGCSFATALAYKYESFIHQLVLISGGGPTPLAPPNREGLAHSCLRTMLSPLLMCGLHRDILYSARGRQHPYCGLEPKEQQPSHMQFMLEGMIWPEGDYTFHRRISLPTLIIHGLRDNMVSLVQECEMERTMIKAFLQVIHAGHIPMTDCPEQINHMIHCFIDLWAKNGR